MPQITLEQDVFPAPGGGGGGGGGGIKEKTLHAGVLIFSRRTHTGSPKEQQ